MRTGAPNRDPGNIGRDKGTRTGPTEVSQPFGHIPALEPSTPWCAYLHCSAPQRRSGRARARTPLRGGVLIYRVATRNSPPTRIAIVTRSSSGSSQRTRAS